MMRRLVATVLAALLTGPTVSLESAPAVGKVQGLVTLEGRPLSGVDVALVELESGSIYRTRSGDQGAFELRLAPGQYTVATESRAGLAVGRAPALVPVRSGQVASASIELLAVPSFRQETEAPPGLPTPVTINHDAVGCLVEGQFPLIESTIEPSMNVARARLFFMGAQSAEYFFVEFGAIEGRFVAKMPKPTMAASPVRYYIQAVTTDGAEVQSPEVVADVVETSDQCPADRKVAAIGPDGEVTVFSAASGSAIKPIGFAAGGALTVGAIALLIAGLAGVAAAITVINPSPTPSPSPTPTATPTPPPTTLPPTPSPTPSPSPSPTSEPPSSPFKF